MSWRQQAKGERLRRPRALKNDGTPCRLGRAGAGGVNPLAAGEKMRGEPVGELYDATYHVPNGGQRNKKTASDLKRQGVKVGVSDLHVRQARGGWHGLYLELKATPPRDAALAQSQFEWLECSEYEGYCAVLALGLEQAKAVLREYASWPRTQIVGEREELKNGTEWRKG